jgi:hypothetical protein
MEIIMKRKFTKDSLMTYDAQTIDSAGAFLIGELERLDQTLHAPLVSVTWSRDIDLREDVSIADESSSFTNSAFAAAGGVSTSGKSWVGKNSTAITGLQLDIAKTSNPLFLWGMEIGYTIPELASAIQLGRPIDVQKYEGLKLKHQMDIDEMVYIGDTSLGKYGLLNNTSVTSGNVAAGESGLLPWAEKRPDEILADVNSLINETWKAAGYAVCPDTLLLPPAQYAYIISQKVSTAGNISILTFLEDNCVALKVNGRKLSINPVKWCAAAGTLGTDRMVAYTKDKGRVRFPMVPLQRTPLEYRGLYQLTTYFGRLGCVEFVYPETAQYADGI